MNIMLTDLRVSFLTSKCVFYRPELNVKVGAHGTEFSSDIASKQKKFGVNKGISKSCIFKRWNYVNGSSEVHNP